MTGSGLDISDFISETSGIFDSLEKFTKSIRQQSLSLPVWAPLDTESLPEEILLELNDMEPGEEFSDSVKRIMLNSIADAYEMIGYVDGQAPQSTFKMAGLLAVTDQVMQNAIELNERKDRLAKAYNKLVTSSNAMAASKAVTAFVGRNDMCKLALGRLGHRRLHIKQASRNIPILEQRPLRVSFSLSHSHSSPRKLSIGTARERLEKIGSSPLIEEQIRLLDDLKLPDDTECLRTIHRRSEVIIANTVFASSKKPIKAPIPLLYPFDGDTTPPKIGYNEVSKGPKLPGVTGRRTRSDKQYTDNRYFLPTLKAYLVRTEDSG